MVKNSKTVFALLGLLLIVAVGIAFMLTRDRSEPVAITTTDEPLPTHTVSSSISESVVSPPGSPVTSIIPTPASLRRNLFVMAEQRFRAGEYTEAISLFNELLEFSPNNQIAITYRGNAYVELGDYEIALSDYTRAIELVPDNYPQAYYNRGRVYMILKEYDRALDDLEKAIELDNYDPINFAYRANGNIGLIYHQLGNYEKALAAFNASIAAESRKADVFYHRGETHAAMGNYQAAISDYEAAIERFTRYDLAYQSLGYVYYKMGQYDQALEVLNQTVSLSPESSEAHFYLALVHLATDDLDNAETEMSRALTAADNLPIEQQDPLFSNMAAELEAFSEEHPDKRDVVDSLAGLIP